MLLGVCSHKRIRTVLGGGGREQEMQSRYDVVVIAKGLFAAGAVRSGHGGMLEHAVGDGNRAAEGAIAALDETS